MTGRPGVVNFIQWGWLINPMGWGLGQVVSKSVEKSGGGSVVLPKITHELIM